MKLRQLGQRCLWLGFLCCLAAKPYQDDKRHFRLVMPDAWALHPLFGDTQSIAFKRTPSPRRGIGQVYFAVRVRPQPMPEFRAWVESGLRQAGALTVLNQKRRNLAGRDAMHKSYRIEAADGRVNYVEISYLGTGESSYALSVEGEKRSLSRLKGEINSIWGSFRLTGSPNAAQKVSQTISGSSEKPAGPPPELLGKWQGASGIELAFYPSGRFRMASVSGKYQTAGGTLKLFPEGKKTRSFRFAVQGKDLVLYTKGMDKPARYRRLEVGTRRSEPEQQSAPQRPRYAFPEQRELIGTWMSAEPPQLKLSFDREGKFRFGEFKGDWKLTNKGLRLSAGATEQLTYRAGVKGDKLVLSGADLDHPLQFARVGR